MSRHDRTRPAIVTAGLVMVAVVLTSLVSTLSTAAPASASSGGSTGSPGAYYLDQDADLRTTMTQAGVGLPSTTSDSRLWFRRTIETWGVSVGRSPAGANDQEITGVYTLEARGQGASTWTPIAAHVSSVTVPGIRHDDWDAPIPTLGRHVFGVPSTMAYGATYRVRFDLSWRDTVTGRQLGSWSIVPDRANNRCPLQGVPNPYPCTVTADGVTW